jgi:hypothetical protein
MIDDESRELVVVEAASKGSIADAANTPTARASSAPFVSFVV